MEKEYSESRSIEKSLNLHRVEDPLLIVEDNRETQVLLQGIFKQMELPVVVADNGEKALEKMTEQDFSLYIVDLMMPVMDGRTFIEKLKKKKGDAVVLVTTALDQSQTIIETMKMGVFDYIIKPIDPELFQNVINKALEYKYLKEQEKNLSINAGLKIRNQIEWLNYKESRRVADKDYGETKSVYNLKTSLSQGAGFGTLVSLIDLIKSTMSEKDENYEVQKDLMDMLFENNTYCRNQLDGLQAVTGIMESTFPLEKISSSELVGRIPDMITSIVPFLERKNLSVTYPDVQINCDIEVNFEKYALMIEEIVINAYKYSVNGSVVNIFTHISEGFFWLSVKNDIPEEPYGGIPAKYEKLVLEPFFRLLPPDESAAKIEKFGFGLGLAIVDNIIRKHNGIFMIHDVKDHTGKSIKSCVLAEILLPVLVDEQDYQD